MFSCICNLPIRNDTLYKAFTLGLEVVVVVAVVAVGCEDGF